MDGLQEWPALNLWCMLVHTHACTHACTHPHLVGKLVNSYAMNNAFYTSSMGVGEGSAKQNGAVGRKLNNLSNDFRNS